MPTKEYKKLLHQLHIHDVTGDPKDFDEAVKLGKKMTESNKGSNKYLTNKKEQDMRSQKRRRRNEKVFKMHNEGFTNNQIVKHMNLRYTIVWDVLNNQ
ncbi:hypothetical protein LABALGNA3A7_09530 [Dellaglioa algida]|nr:hypothetical protein LABALGNA3A7_09530 [Dellaglioa algida]